MKKIKKFNIENISARYKNPEIRLVSLEEVKSSDECRLYFEIFLSIGLTLLGVIVQSFNLVLFITSLISLGLSGFFIIRYITKNKKLNEF